MDSDLQYASLAGVDGDGALPHHAPTAQLCRISLQRPTFGSTIHLVTITERELLRLYGSAATAGNAALFVGAGLSLSAGHPTWTDLLAAPRAEAQIPAELDDLPLVAQYYIQTVAGGREALESHILSCLSDSTVTAANAGHRWIAQLPVDDIWTTNYDCLVEQAIGPSSVVASDDDLKERRHLQSHRVMKMHGSLTPSNPPQWRQSPVITRQDYEEYETRNPRLWAALRATYLTKSLLFLGFSFTDPNIDVLLRLSRTLLQVGAPEHFTVLRRPKDKQALRLHDLQVADLERTGVAVCEVSDFDELEPILRRLVRRTRERTLFISGSDSSGSDIKECCRRLGNQLAPLNVRLSSLAGPAAMRVSFALGRADLAEARYDADRIRFHFRKTQTAPPPLEERIGTAVYTDLDKQSLRERVLSQCRAAIIIGGGTNTEEEVQVARSLGVPVVPLARSKGAAESVWNNISLKDSGISLDGSEGEARDWNLLNAADIDIASAAAIRLLKRAMYLDDD